MVPFDFFKKGKKRVEENLITDVGKISHYEGSPFTGIMFGESYEIEMVNGLKDGIWKEFYDEGKIKLEKKCSRDEVIEITGFYIEDGTNIIGDVFCIPNTLLKETKGLQYYNDNLFTGLCLFEKADSLVEYEDGKMIRRKMYWRNGKIRGEYESKEGKDAVFFYKDEIELRYWMDDGRLVREIKDEVILDYHDNGNISKETKKVPDGYETKEYYKSGKLSFSYKSKSLDYLVKEHI